MRIDAAHLGSLTVAHKWCHLDAPSLSPAFIGDTETLNGQVYLFGVTDQTRGPSAGMWMQAGLEAPGSAAFTWVDAGWTQSIDRLEALVGRP